MSQQLELLTENPSQWTTVTYVTPEIQKKEIKPFVVLAIKELEGNPDSRTSSLMNADKFAAVRAVVRHLARSRSATKYPWREEDVVAFLEGLRFSPECVSELSALVCVDKIYDNIPTHLRVRPALLSFQWKIDLSLSQSQILSENASNERRKELTGQHACAVLTMVVSGNQSARSVSGADQSERRVWRASGADLRALRHCVAAALKSMIVLKGRQCMRRD